MKKYLLIMIFTVAIPAYAACPIDTSGETVCSLPEFRQQVTPIFNDSNNLNLSNPSVNLQPLTRTDPIEQMRGPNNNLNYNSGCQFGVCLQNPNESKLPQEQNNFN